MKTLGFLKVSFAVAVMSVLASGATGANYYWKADGEGGWNSPKRWGVGSADGPDGVPGPSDTLRFYGVRAEITDDDAALVSTLNEAVMGQEAVLVLNMTTNATIGLAIQGSSSTVIKLNGNTVDMSRTKSTFQLRGGDVVVSNGVLKVGKQIAYYPATYHVWSPGVLELPDTQAADGYYAYYVAAVAGDGTIRYLGTNNYFLRFIGDRFATVPGEAQYLLVKPPYDFSGTFEGKLGLIAGARVSVGDDVYWWGPYRQRFTGTQTTDSALLTPRFIKGIFEVAAPGKMADGTSSLGEYDNLSFFNDTTNPGDGTGFVYLGPAGATTRRGLDLYYDTLGTFVSVDGGPNGGLTFETGNWSNLTAYNQMRPDGTTSRLILCGTNAAECVVKSDVKERDEIASLAVVKQGSGAWRFEGAKGFAGPVFTEQGTFRFDSVFERGTKSALGTAGILYTNWFGAADCAPYAVPFAWMLGDGRTDLETPDLATMEYTGSGTAASASRPLAVRGAGRMDGGESNLRLSGAFSAAEGVNTLVLGGTGTDNLYADVTNGVGVLRVVKEDAGTWRLSGDVKLGGGIEVRFGKVKVSNRFSWYRLNMKAPVGAKDNDIWFGFRLFGLWDADGNLLSSALTGRDVNGNVATLGVNESGLNLATDKYANSTATRSWINGAFAYKSVDDPLNPVQASLFRMKVNAATKANVLPRENDESTWVRGVMRFADDMAPATCYDMKTEEGPTSDTAVYELSAFGVDGSPDGIHWTELHSYSGFSDWGGSGRWYSTKATTRTNADGFRLKAIARDATKTVQISSVRVDKDAELELEPEANVEVGGIVYDVAAGGGRITGAMALAANGTFEVLGTVSKGKALDLPMDLSKVDGLENVREWPVRINGAVTDKWSVSASPAGFKLLPHGLVIVVK